MKYNVLKECINPFNAQKLCPGEVHDWDVDKYEGIMIKQIFAAMIHDGFIARVVDGPWKPVEGDTHFFLSDNGEIQQEKVDSEKYCDMDYTVDTRYEIGNCFQIGEQAERAVEWLKAFKVLRDDTKGFKPNWKDRNELKWTVGWDLTSQKFDTTSTRGWSSSLLPFRTDADARESIKGHKKEWKTFLGIEE